MLEIATGHRRPYARSSGLDHIGLDQITRRPRGRAPDLSGPEQAQGAHVKKRFIAPTAIALAVAAGLSGGAVSGIVSAASASGGTLTVWLMTGDSTTAATNSVSAQFEQDYPGWTVNVEVQQWSGITAKVLTSLASSSPPDVMELGNTDVAEYAASGGLTNLTADKGQFANSSDWLSG